MQPAKRWRRAAAGPLCRAAVLAGVFVSTAISSPARKPLSEVTAIRFWTLGDVTRIAIEVSDEATYTYERLHDPERIFFDLKDSRSKLGKKGYEAIPVGDSLVKQIRIAQTQPSVARVVVDLTGEAEFTASKLANPFRLIIELHPKGPAAARPPAAVTPPATAPVETAPLKPVAAAPAPVTTAPAKVPAAKPEIAEKPPAKKTEPPAPAAVPAKSNSRGERTLARALGLKVGRVVIDAGHGGHDHGTTGPSGLTEKDLVLDIALRLGKLIEDRLQSEVIQTRTDDTFLPLEERTRIANEAKADLFLSIHANSSPLKSVSGVETFYLNFTTSKADLEVAARENATSQKTIHELTELLQKIAKKDKAEESREFAVKVQSALYSASARQNSRSRNRGVKKAPFVVLIGASMPSVLVEVGFISNARDEALYRKPEQRQRMAEALFKGLSQYADTLSHFQVAQTKNP